MSDASRITNPELKMFIEFFKTQGVKFVDAETGKEIYTDEEDRTNVLGAADRSSSDDDNSGENIIRVVRR